MTTVYTGDVISLATAGRRRGSTQSNSTTPTNLTVSATGDGATWTIVTTGAAAGAAILIFNQSTDALITIVDASGITGDLTTGQTVYCRALENGKIRSGRYPASSGVLVPSNFPAEPPSEPVLAVTDSADGGGFVATWTGADLLPVNVLYVQADGSDIWTSRGSGSGVTGTITSTVTEPGIWWFYLTSTNSTNAQSVSNVVRLEITDGSTSESGSPAMLIAGKGETGTLQTFAKVKNPDGTLTRSWTNGASIYVWLQATSSDIRTQYERREITVTHKAFTVTDPETMINDRLVVSRGTFLIHGVIDQAGLGRVWRLDLEEVRE